MKPRIIALTALLLCASIVAQESSKPRKFQTTYKIDIYAEAGVNAKKIGRFNQYNL